MKMIIVPATIAGASLYGLEMADEPYRDVTAPVEVVFLSALFMVLIFLGVVGAAYFVQRGQLNVKQC